MRYTLVLLIALFTLTVSAFAQVSPAPSLLNFQGRLARPDGTPVPDGNYSVRFSLWSAASAGTERWNQTINPVAVKNGTFAVLLNVASPATLFDSDLWLEIKIGTNAALTPRQRLVSVAYAMKANSVPDNSITSAKIVDGTLTSADIANGTITGADIANATITADKLANGTLNTLSWLLGGNSGTNPASQFLGTTDNQALAFRTNNAERMRLLPNGSLGIGTNAPTQALDVVGNIRSRGADFILDGRGGGVGNSGHSARALVDGGFNDGLLVPRYGLILNFDNDFGIVWVDSDLALTNSLMVGKGFTGVPEGLSWEVGGFNPILNLDLNFRLPGRDNTYPGGAVRIDSRDGIPLFQFWGRSGGSDVENLLFRIESNGNVGIGNVTPVFKFEVDGTTRVKDNVTVQGSTDSRMILTNSAGASLVTVADANRAWLRTTNSAHPLWLGTNNGVTLAIQGGTVGIGTTTPNVSYALHVAGNVLASRYDLISDTRYKQNITTLENPFDAILNLRGVSYDWKQHDFPDKNFPTERQIGFIAQEVEKILPDLVSTDEKGYKSVNYVGVVPVLVEAVKTLKTEKDMEIKTLRTENALLRKQLDALTEMVQQVKAAQEAQRTGNR